MAAIFFKIGLVLASGLLGAWAVRSRLVELPERPFLAAALALQLVPALVLFVALYVMGHLEPTSDVPTFYVPAGRAVLAGEVPFRDFNVSYAPGFAYVSAALTFLWNSGKAFALFAILLNAVALVCWHCAARATFDSAATRHCTILYATSGHVLVQALLGTNQAWLNSALAASALLIARDREVASGVAQALAACATKVLAHLFWPVMFICADRRYRWLLAAAVPTTALYAAFVVAGAGPGLLYPLRHEGELISPGNVPYLLNLALDSAGPLERVIDDGLTLAALIVATVWLYMKARALGPRGRRTLVLAGLALTGLVFMLFSKKSFTGYVIFVMYPVVLMLVVGVGDWRARAGWLLAFNTLLVAEPSLWFYMHAYDWSLRKWFAIGGGARAAGFVLVDLALLVCYMYLTWLSVRCVGRMVEGAIASRNASHSTTACSLV
jgi:hypothetical protein